MQILAKWVYSCYNTRRQGFAPIYGKAGGRMTKRAADSQTLTTRKMSYQYLNRKGELYGGKLLDWTDEAATIAAERHAGGHVTTALLDSYTFLAPVFLEDLVTLCACVTFVGRSSMEIRVDVFAERAGEPRRPVGRAFVVMVAVDENGAPMPAPALMPATPEEEADFEAGRLRMELRKKNRANFSEMR